MVRRALAPVAALVVTVLAACQGDPAASTTPHTQERSTLAPSEFGAPRAARSPGAAEVIPGQYLVVFRSGGAAGSDVVELRTAAKLRKAKKPTKLKHTYSTVLQGFAAELEPEDVAELRADPEVALVEPDPVVRMAGSQANATWGLDRIDQASLPLNGSYNYGNEGAGVTVYILDTGINTGHVDFGGRAVGGYDAVTAGGSAGDCNGHGTHVAGTVGGTTWGVAKSVRLVSVRVLDCSGNGAGSSLLAGMDYVVRQKQANPGTPAVANLSLVGGASSAFDQAVQNMINAGVATVVAAGNASVDACTVSPSRLPAAITVGASDANDVAASFSNFGACVDLVAPGVVITSTYVGSSTATAAMSGTSMATPHVAGAAALYLGANGSASPAQVHGALVSNSVVGRVSSLVGGQANRLLSVSFLGGSAPAPAPPAAHTTPLSITPPTTSLPVGSTLSLTATGSAVSGANVYYRASDPTIAQVETWSGKVTALRAGTVTIFGTAQAAGYPTAAVQLTVTAPVAPAPVPDERTSAPLSIAPAASSLSVGGSLILTATGSAVSGANVYYRASDPTIAQVETWSGQVTALRAGTVTIFGTAQAAGYPTAAVQLTVTEGTPTPAPSAPLTISLPAGGLSVGATTTVLASGSAVSGSNVYYRSSDPGVVQVDAWSGRVMALRAGTVMIFGTAQVSGYPSASVEVIVR
jgi:uncharacterized protein YjdB